MGGGEQLRSFRLLNFLKVSQCGYEISMIKYQCGENLLINISKKKKKKKKKKHSQTNFWRQI